MRTFTQAANPSRHRYGFTLVELLVVIVILGVLIGLLVPAVMQAVGKAKEAQAAAEIQGLAQALAQFKSQFNEYPPSRIVVSENGDYTASTLGQLAPLGQRTMSAFKRFWPRLQFDTTQPLPAGTLPSFLQIRNTFYDVNGDGQMQTTPYVLQGPECLVLFLGGIPQSTGAGASGYGAAGGVGWSVTGFAKDPTNPFQNAVKTTNRTAPLFEFNNSRLVSNASNQGGPPGGFPGYVDSLGAPSPDMMSQGPNGPIVGLLPFYVYFSAYGGVGYDPADCDMLEPDPLGQYPAIMGAFTSGNCIPAGSNSAINNGAVASPAPNPYTNDVPVTTASGSGNYVPPATGTAGKSRPWQNPTSFQIISPGRDRYYGIGGQYISNGTAKLPFIDTTKTTATTYAGDTFQTVQANATVTGQMLSLEVRNREADNVTNFSQGRLD